VKRIGTTVAFILYFFTSFGQQVGDTVRLHPIIGNPPNPAAIDIVILGDGYIDVELGNGNLFDIHAGNVVDELILNTSPFTQYANYFNIYRIDVQSQQQGIDEPCIGPNDTLGSICNDTLFNTFFNVGYDGTSPLGAVVDRFPTADFDTIEFVLNQNGFDPQTTMVILLVNCQGQFDTQYEAHNIGGGFPDRNLCIVPAASPFVVDQRRAMHEFAHSFARLHDEYWTGASGDWAKDTLNMSDTNLLALVPWRNWVDTTVWYPGIEDISNTSLEDMHTLPIGIYPHLRIDTPNYHSVSGVNQWVYDLDSIIGWFKPTTYYNCKLEDDYYDKDYCPVCREAIIERIHLLAPAMYGYSPNNVDTVTASEELTFQIEFIQTTNGSVEIDWYLNGESVNTNTTGTWQVDCDAPQWNIGLNTVTAVVEDTTDWIRIDDHSGHTQSVTWNVEFNGAEADLWVADIGWDEGDTQASVPVNWDLDLSPDIWVRNTNDGVANQVHEDPNYATGDIHAYTRVRNRGCKTSSPNRSLNLYWTFTAGGWGWPENFNGAPLNLGDMVGSNDVPPTSTFDTSIVEIAWPIQNIPFNLLNDNGNQACLLARLDSTTTDTNVWYNGLAEYVWYNNNMALLNLSVLNVEQEVKWW
jgi:hypothetical protein